MPTSICCRYSCQACALPPVGIHDFIKHIKRKHFFPKEILNTSDANVPRNRVQLDPLSARHPSRFQEHSSCANDSERFSRSPKNPYNDLKINGIDNGRVCANYHESENSSYTNLRNDTTFDAESEKVNAADSQQSFVMSPKINIESTSHFDRTAESLHSQSFDSPSVNERIFSMDIHENEQAATGVEETLSVSVLKGRRNNMLHPSKCQHFMEGNSINFSKPEGAQQCHYNPSCANKTRTDADYKDQSNGMFCSPSFLIKARQASYEEIENKNTVSMKISNEDGELHYNKEHFQGLKSLLASDLVTMPDCNVLQNINRDEQTWGTIQRILHQSFSIFPYLSEQEGLDLGVKTGLTLKQIKILFALARLQHGISWEEDEIRNARKLIFRSET